MACLQPLRGFRSRRLTEKGKRGIVFNVKDGFTDLPVTLRCGRCISCRLERSRQWAMRCVHEASMHDANVFVTLTFSDQYLDPSGSLVKADFQLFMKRLRKYVDGVCMGQRVRFYHAGEYGEVCMTCRASRLRCMCNYFVPSIGRPHHHVIIFGMDFSDKVLWKCVDGIRLYRSAVLEKLWPYGFASVGDVTFESAAYVARYVVKKITGKPAGAHYGARLPEYSTMSRRPGIARPWFEQFKSDVFPLDEVVIRGGVKCRPPQYYSRLYSLTDPDDYGRIVGERERACTELERREPLTKFGKVSKQSVYYEVMNYRVEQLKRGRADE